ncbi:MAG TPA: hypothetical protein GXZ86_04995 [Clostridiales bacterium]|jgi:predicted MPP superfamily phosphohydrolase|nr:hypothetical protein [Clostridiales bacterium]
MAKKYRTSLIGALMAKLPRNCRLLYPLYFSTLLQTVKDSIYHPSLPEGLHGFSIAYASDVHYGPMFSKERALDLANKLNALQADLILLGGDYGETTKTSIKFWHLIPKLKVKKGVIAVLGNHDLWGSEAEIDSLTNLIQEKGAVLLRNSAHALNINGAKLCLVATDDGKEGKPDLTLFNRLPACDFSVFCPHSPDILPEFDQNGSYPFSLAICGHTHGGQVALFNRSIISSSKYGDRYRTGHMIENQTPILVSNGVGTSTMPVRLGAMPQIHYITLLKGNEIKSHRSEYTGP